MPLPAMAGSRAKPTEKPYKPRDERGMFLLVTPSGGRYWRFNVRFDDQYRTLALGTYPDVPLADARARREAARKLIAEDVDPARNRKQEAAKAEPDASSTFERIAEEWLAKREREGLGEVTIAKAKWLLGFVYPELGARKISEITSLELLAVLRSVEARGRHESARRLRSVCGRVYRYAIATGRAEHDLTANLRDALTTPKVKHLAAITHRRTTRPGTGTPASARPCKPPAHGSFSCRRTAPTSTRPRGPSARGVPHRHPARGARQVGGLACRRPACDQGALRRARAARSPN